MIDGVTLTFRGMFRFDDGYKSIGNCLSNFPFFELLLYIDGDRGVQ